MPAPRTVDIPGERARCLSELERLRRIWDRLLKAGWDVHANHLRKMEIEAEEERRRLGTVKRRLYALNRLERDRAATDAARGAAS